MSLSAGTTIGSYHVTAKIGEGGKGEVWQARDTKLDRDVALKVLPEAFTSDPDRLARFEREAKVGTAAYMSPEQARGKTVDWHSDVWAFGCVLYEMLTGRRAFVGENVSDTLVAVLTADVDLDALPDGVPPARSCDHCQPLAVRRELEVGAGPRACRREGVPGCCRRARPAPACRSPRPRPRSTRRPACRPGSPRSSPRRLPKTSADPRPPGPGRRSAPAVPDRTAQPTRPSTGMFSRPL